MARWSGYVEDVLEQLAPLGPVQARRMFSGSGLFLGGRMFALILQERLYFKTDDTTRAAFEAAGGEPFVYTKAGGKAVTLSYWTPPPDAVDDALALLPWARRALEAARRAAAVKPRASRPSSPRRGRASPRPRRTS
jgi:DNA transformation protein and related proteins